MSTIIKICGITQAEDGLHALRSGADWLGLIRWKKSARYRSAEDAAAMLAHIRGAVPRAFETVGVYVNEAPEVIDQEVIALGLNRVQLHGDETPEHVAAVATRIRVPLLKVIKIKSAESLAAAERYPELDLLTDTDHPALRGGTGEAYDYALLLELVQRRRVMIAGGLTPMNVADIVRGLRPFGIDVSSGVEASPGIKDPALVAAFIAAVRSADHQNDA